MGGKVLPTPTTNTFMKQSNKLSRTIIAIVMTLGVSLSALAHDFEVDGIYYNILDKTAKTVEVTFSGGSYNKVDDEYTGDVVIPNSVTYGSTTFSVTAIGSGAFDGCTGLTSVTIPNSVTAIGSCALRSCSGLTSVTIPSSVTSIGSWAFSGCSGLTSVIIPNSVTAIGSGAFDGCSGLTSVTIPNSVTAIGSVAFRSCSGLTSVTIPSSVTSIGSWAFLFCDGLTDVNITDLSAWCKIDFYIDKSNPLSYANHLKLNGTEITNLVIPNDITEIKQYAFSGCDGLTSVSIPNSVTSIGDEAFMSCSGLNSVTIPNSVTSIGTAAFIHCAQLTEVTIPNSVTAIGVNAFNGCDSLSSVNITDLSAWCKINFVNEYSNPLIYAQHFKLNGSEITNLVIPNDITEIKKYAFINCDGLTSMSIPNSVTSIGDEAFMSCSGLNSVTIPNSVTSIGAGTFRSCSGLTSIVVERGNTTYDSRDNCNAIIETASNALIEGCKNTTIPNSVTSIGKSVFAYCSGLTSIVVKSKNTTYDSRDNCNAIIETASNTLIAGCKNTIIPNSVTAIGDDAFLDCDGLTSIAIPNSVTSVGDRAFLDCSNLTSVTIGNSVNSIGNEAFMRCSKLNKIVINSENTTFDSRDNSNAIIETKTNTLIAGCKNTIIPNSITSIEDDAFNGCYGLTSVTIPNSVTSIGHKAFYECI